MKIAFSELGAWGMLGAHSVLGAGSPEVDLLVGAGSQPAHWGSLGSRGAGSLAGTGNLGSWLWMEISTQAAYLASALAVMTCGKG